MTEPYYADDHVTLYLGDCLKIREWLAAKILFTDPPYGRRWRQGTSKPQDIADDAHAGIAGDIDTSTRDAALALWGADRRAIVFGDLMLAPPPGTRQVAIYRKPTNAGTRGATAKTRRDAEAIYLMGPWPSSINGGRSSIFGTESWTGNPSSPQGRYRHPHAKPLDLDETLLDHLVTETTTIAVPFAGAGAEVIAARNLGHSVIAVEVHEADCEMTARRLAADVLNLN